MKRLLVVSMAVAVVFTSNPAGAEILKNLRLSGQIDLQGTSANNVLDFASRKNPLTGVANNDRIGDAQTRIMLNLDWDLLDDVHARVGVNKNDRTWGTAGGNPQEGANNQVLTGNGADGSVLGDTYVDEAYFKVDKVAGQFDATIGRQFYGDSGDVVIYYGPSDKAEYGMPVDAIDALRADWGTEWLSVTGLVAKQKGAQIGQTARADIDVRGLNMLLKGNENFRFSLYGWNKLTHATGASGQNPNINNNPINGKNDNLYLVGTKIKVAGAGFWLKGEFDQNFGENRVSPINSLNKANYSPDSHYEGWAMLGGTGWKGDSDSAGSLTLWGEGAIGSGRSSTYESKNDGFATINGDYRPGSIYGRFASSLAFGGLGSTLFNNINATDATATTNANSFVSNSTLANRVIWGGGIKISPAVANKFSLAVSWWDYRMHRFGRVPGGVNPYNGNKHIGAELDVDVVWTHSENVAFATGWGTFQPGGLIQQAAQNNDPLSISPPNSRFSQQPVNPITLAYFDVRVKF